MSISTKGKVYTRNKPSGVAEEKPPMPKLNVKDTDFILKVFYRSEFSGKELEQAFGTLNKVATLHQRNLGNEE